MRNPSTLENKDATARAGLIERLLNSPLAKQLEKSLSGEDAQERARLQAELDDCERLRRESQEEARKVMPAKLAEVEAAKLAYEKLKRETEALGDRFTGLNEHYSARRAEIRRLLGARRS